MSMSPVDEIGTLACQAQAVLACVRSASLNDNSPAPDDAIADAIWAAEDMIGRMHALAIDAIKEKGRLKIA